MFYPFIDDAEVELVGAEAGGRGLRAGEHAASLTQGQPGVLHGSFSYVLQDEDGQTRTSTRSRPGSTILASAPSTATGKTSAGSATRASPTPKRSTPTTHRPARRHPPRARVEPRPGPGVQGGRRLGPEKILVVCLSGRGDKDAYEVARLRGESFG